MLDKFKRSLMKFMQGRYGIDLLAKRLNVLFFILAIVSIILGINSKNNGLITALALLVLIYMYYRIFSKNYTARMRENSAYKKLEGKILTPLIKFKRKIFGTKTHIYTNCPYCRTDLRLPRGKGKIKVTCPKCGKAFLKRT